MAEIDGLELSETPRSFISHDEDDNDTPSIEIPKSFQPHAPEKHEAAPPVNHAENPDVDRLISEAKGSLGKADKFYDQPQTSTDKKVDGTVKKFTDTVSSAYQKLNEPITDLPSRIANRVSNYINPERTVRGAKGIGSAYVESLGNTLSGLTSPMNLGLTALSGGAGAARGAGMEGIAEAANTGARLLSAPIAAHGAYSALRPDASLDERLLGAIEAAGGTLGMRSHIPEAPPVRRSSEIPYNLTGKEPSPIRRGTGASEEWWRNHSDIDFSQMPKPGERLPELPESAKGPNDEANLNNPWIKDRLRETNEFFTGKPKTDITPEEVQQAFKDVSEPTTRPPDDPFEIQLREMEQGLPKVEEAGGESRINASGDSAASMEALSRQKGMADRGEQFIVVDRAGNERPLLGPDAVDYNPRPGETYGIKDKEGNFKTLTDNGGLVTPSEIKPNFENPFKKTELSEMPKSFQAHDLEPLEAHDMGEVPKSFEAHDIQAEEPVQETLKSKVSEPEITQLEPDFIDTSERAREIQQEKGISFVEANRLARKEVLPDIPREELPGSEAPRSLQSRNESIQSEPKVRLGRVSEIQRERRITFSEAERLAKEEARALQTEETVEMHGGLGFPGFGGKSKYVKSTGPYATALDKLFDSMGSISENRTAQDVINKAEKAKRFSAFNKVEDSGYSGASKQLSKLKGDYEKVNNPNIKMSMQEVDSLFDGIKRTNISAPEKARGYTALFKIINGGEVPTRSELAILDHVFGNNFAARITEMQGGLGAVKMNLAKAANTMKAMRSSIDLSAPLRQGIGLVHRPEYRAAAKEMFKYMASPEHFEEAMNAIREHPLYPEARDSGLFIADSHKLTGGEEAFMNNYAGNIPVIGKAVDASERAYTGFLNDLRFNTFKNLVENAKASGLITSGEEGASQLTKDIARFVNTSTGRGSLGNLEKYAGDLNTVLWSPRFLASRLTTLNPNYYMKLEPLARREALKSLFAIAGSGLTTLGLMKAAGAKVSLNPESADFGKARFEGGRVMDPWAGFQQPVVAAMRFISGSANGHPQTRTTTAENFFANKLSPMGSLAYEVGSALQFNKKTEEGDISKFQIPGFGGFKNRYGQQKYLNREVAQQFVPMFLDDASALFKSDAGLAEQVGLDAYSLFGGGVQNYPENKPKELTFRKPQLR